MIPAPFVPTAGHPSPSAAAPLSSRYKVRAPAGGGGKFPRCRLPISVGQEYHEGEKLKATIDWVNRYAGDPFEACDIVVCDFLQRHTAVAMEGLDPRNAARVAMAAGAAWIARNRTSLDALVVPTTIVRWGDVRSVPRYREMRDRLDRLVAEQPGFAEIIDSGSRAFTDRVHARGVPVPDAEQLERISREYLLEEMAVFSILQELQPAVDCYPGSWAPFLAAKTGIPGVPGGLRDIESVQLRLKRRSAEGAPASS